MTRWLVWAIGVALAVAAWAAPPIGLDGYDAVPPTGLPDYRVCAMSAAPDAELRLVLGSDRPGWAPVTIITAAGSDQPFSLAVNEAGGGSGVLPSSAPAGVVVEELGQASAAALVQSGPTGLAASMCPGRPAETVALAGLSTLEGDSAELVLANPYAEDAVVTVRSTSELGLDTVAGLESLTVPAGSLLTRNLSEVLALRTTLAVTVRSERGRVAASVRYAPAGGGVANLEAVALETEWWIPIPEAVADLAIVVATDSPSAVSVQVDVYGLEGVIEAYVDGEEVDTSRLLTLTRQDLPEGVTAVRVVASAPVVTGVVFRGEGSAAGGSGATGLGGRWLLPGAGSSEGAETIVWVMNPDPADVTVVLQALVPGARAEPFTVFGESVLGIPLGGGPVPGQLLTADGPVAVAWTARVEAGDRAYAAGVRESG
jgi:hypothetical protein